MKLHCPSETRIFFSDKQHKCGLEFQFFCFRQHFSSETFCKDRFHLFIGSPRIHHIFQRVIGSAASHTVKKCHPLFQRRFQVGKRMDFYFRRSSKLFQVISVIRFLDIHRLVRTPCRKYLHFKTVILCDHFVPLQRICRIIRRTQQSNA